MSHANTKQMINMLRNKTAVDDIINELKHTFDAFAEKREDFYITECLNDAIDADERMSDEQAYAFSKQIANKVHKDVLNYVDEYTSSIIDDVLDLINSKKIDKDEGHIILTILSATKLVFVSESV